MLAGCDCCPTIGAHAMTTYHMRNKSDFIAAHRHVEAMLLKYSSTKLGRAKLGDNVLEDLLMRSAMSLKATNATSRIAFSHSLQEVLPYYVGRDFDQTFFVTLAPPFTARSLDTLISYNGKGLMEWATVALSGFRYFGMIDFGVYLNPPYAPWNKLVSPHVHATVWGTTDEQMELFCTGLNRNYPSLLPDKNVAHFQPIKSDEALHSTISYLSKAPLKSTKVYGRPRSNVSGSWEYQSEIFARPGLAAEVFTGLHGLSLPELCLTHGSRDIVTDAALLASARIDQGRFSMPVRFSV